MTDTDKIKQLRDLLGTVVKNTKKADVNGKEVKQTAAVLETMLGRKPTELEVVSAMAN